MLGFEFHPEASVEYDEAVGYYKQINSTLLKILSRVTMQSEGRIKVRGRIASLLEVGTGFHPELTGREPKGWPPVRSKSTSNENYKILKKPLRDRNSPHAHA